MPQTTTRRTTARLASLAFTLAAFALVPPGEANAHASKEATVPKDGSTVVAPTEIVMTFDGAMRITVFTLEGEIGAGKTGEGETGEGETGPSETGAIETASEQGFDPVTRYVATPTEPLAPGDYTVEWRGMSEDGHVMQGAFGFSVTP